VKVLAVDDALVWRMALQAMVTSLGHECLVAANGREAWQILRAGGIEVLISDRNMPDMDGAQLCSLVRAQASTYVYVILATGLDDPLQVQEGIAGRRRRLPGQAGPDPGFGQRADRRQRLPLRR